MAQPTTSTPPENPQQARTPGVAASPGTVPAGTIPASMGAAPQGVFGAGTPQRPDTPPAPPVLFEDIEPVYLMRLYPQSKDGRADAMKAGQAAFDISTKIAPSQYEPLTGVVEGGPPREGAPPAEGTPHTKR